MGRCLFCKIFIYFLVIHDSIGQSPSFNCTSGDKDSECRLSGLRLTNTTKHFTPVPHLPISAINAVAFKKSKIVILTADVCVALPYIEKFYARRLGLTSVEKNAFKDCRKMTHVSLWGNSLKLLPFGLFDSNVDLTWVDLESNKLTNIDGNLFRNNPNLEELYLNFNQLQMFSFSAETPVMKILKNVYLRSNELSEIDVMMLLKKGPHLKCIYLEGNKFACNRQNEIREILTSKEINNDLKKCVEPAVATSTTTHELTTELAVTTPGTPKLTETTSKSDNIQDLKGEILDLKSKHHESNLISITSGSIVVILILVLGVGLCWIMNQYRTQPDEYECDYREPGGHIPLKERNMSRCNVPVFRDDPYYEYVEGLNNIAQDKVIRPITGAQVQVPATNDEADYFDRLNFNRHD